MGTLRNRYTDPQQVLDFVKTTKVDGLAVAIGNSYGKYKGVPEMDFQRLEKIRSTAGIPLVLRGGFGLTV